MKREKSDDEDAEKGCAFVRSLLEPLPSDALPAQQERTRKAALAGLTEAIETLARHNLPLEEQDDTLRIYRRAWLTLDSLDITDPGTPEKLIQIALEIKAARDGLITALFFDLNKQYINSYHASRRT